MQLGPACEFKGGHAEASYLRDKAPIECSDHLLASHRSCQGVDGPRPDTGTDPAPLARQSKCFGDLPEQRIPARRKRIGEQEEIKGSMTSGPAIDESC